MKYTVESVNKVFKRMNDQERYRFLLKEKDNPNFPEYKIEIDNDAVFISFKEEEDKEDPISPSFNEHGYYALNEILNALGLNADFV